MTVNQDSTVCTSEENKWNVAKGRKPIHEESMRADTWKAQNDDTTEIGMHCGASDRNKKSECEDKVRWQKCEIEITESSNESSLNKKCNSLC